MANYNNFPSYGSYPQYPQNSFQQQYPQPIQPMQINPYMGQANMSNSGYVAQQQIIISDLVDGDVGARSFRPSSGWLPNALYALFDMNDPYIYFRSTNQFGVPTKIQKAIFRLEDPQVIQPETQQHLQSGNADAGNQRTQQATNVPDMSDYVSKEDMAQMEERIKAAITSVGISNAAESKGARQNGKSPV